MLIPEFVFSRRFTFRRFFFRSLHSQGDSLSGDFFPEFVFSFFPEIFFPEFAFSRRFSFRRFFFPEFVFSRRFTFFQNLHSQGDSLFSGDFFSGVCILKEIHFFSGDFFSGVCILVFILAPFFKHLCVGVSLVLRSVFMFSTLFCFKDALKKSD